MADRLRRYRGKRDTSRTPEPGLEPDRGSAGEDTREPGRASFVIQQHHARSLHWDFRLERDGVLVSWAIPKGVPRDQKRNHLAVHTEDHPMEYADFAGEIPEGEYGAGVVTIYDRGTYTTEKWRDDEVMVILDGERTSGRHVLFHTHGDNWMIHRMDPPEAGWQPMPELIRPMAATRGQLPTGAGWAYEMRWDGVRAIGYVSGGRLRLRDPDDAEITARYPELVALAEQLAPVECVLDGEIVALDASGRPSAELLRHRAEGGASSRERGGSGGAAQARRPARRSPVTYLAYDLLHLDGQSLLTLGYAERRERLGALEIAGEHWQTPPYFPGDGAAAATASREQGLSGVVAKRMNSTYRPGVRTRDWRDVERPGHGSRSL